MPRTQPPSPPVSNLRIVAMLTLAFLMFVVMLFIPAGTLRWPAGWLYMLVYFSYAVPVVFWLKKHSPTLLRKRFGADATRMKPWDKALMTLMTFPFLGVYIVPALDVRFHWSNAPLLTYISGFIGLILSFGIFFWVMIENAYASRIVEIQKGQKVISTGSYAVVRHPMYAAGIAFALLTPLSLGSVWGLIPAVLVIPFLALRAVLEEKTLLKELPGYRAYAKKVKYRFLPGVW
ncbi:isoprenylcysteine carboxylmethyltransferase family protein [Candidatus Peregrinibacteria bacterium]|nr:isoprenylcysteine carboxylmethyltransferase family protein [Candidatus Peregrinibacteria bacterium]